MEPKEPQEPTNEPTNEVNKRYTLKKNKIIDNWLFHPDYFTEETRFLPMSQQNLVRNRLIQSKVLPIPEDNIKDIHPVIKAKIDAIVSAYTKKQNRSRIYSEKKREKQKEKINIVESDESETSDSEGEELNELINDFHKKFGI